jgi:hypothetical protein
MFMGIIVVVERIYREPLKTAETAGVEVEGKEQMFTNGYSLEP